MKNKIINLVIVISCIVVLIELLINKTLVFNTISYSLDIWIKSIIPSLFPFFIISDILINYNITNYIPKFIKNIFSKLFNVSDSVVTIFFLSLLSGFPSNARNARTMVDNKLISSEEATHALMFTHFSNPLFILGTLSMFFVNEKICVIVLITHYLSNVIIGIMFRNSNTISNIDYTLSNKKSQNFPSVFIKAVRNSIDTLLTIFGTLSCFLVLSSIIINRLNLGMYNSTILKGILEITMGLKSLAEINISDIYIVVIASMFVSFGGLSVHMQVLSFLIDTDISYKPFFMARIIQGAIAGILAYFIYIIFI